MIARTSHTVIYDDDAPRFVVVPYDDYVEAFSNEALIPHEVVAIQVDRDCTLMEAWRRHKGMTQEAVAAELEISQPAYAKMEKGGNPRPETLERVAAVFEVEPEQLRE